MPKLNDVGWELIDGVYAPKQLQALQAAVDRLEELQDEAVRGRAGAVYAARNVLELIPEVIQLWRSPPLIALLLQTLGAEAGLVRALFFDKPPEQTWALPWHKDLLIAVDEATRPIPGYSTPRRRAGVLHTEPPVEVLESMLTLRIHLDDMTTENGPLQVLDRSHSTGKTFTIHGFTPTTITCQAGDVLAMRPLLVHASGRSAPQATSHRRILHLEFSGLPQLPGGIQWHTFHPIR